MRKNDISFNFHTRKMPISLRRTNSHCNSVRSSTTCYSFLMLNRKSNELATQAVSKREKTHNNSFAHRKHSHTHKGIGTQKANTVTHTHTKFTNTRKGRKRHSFEYSYTTAFGTANECVCMFLVKWIRESWPKEERYTHYTLCVCMLEKERKIGFSLCDWVCVQQNTFRPVMHFSHLSLTNLFPYLWFETV